MLQIILKERTAHLASYTIFMDITSYFRPVNIGMFLRTAFLQNTSRSSRLQMFFKISFLKSFANFRGKLLCWGLVLKNLEAEGLQLHKKRLQYRSFPVKFAKFLRTPFFTEHYDVPSVENSEFAKNCLFKLNFCDIKKFTLCDIKIFYLCDTRKVSFCDIIKFIFCDIKKLTFCDIKIISFCDIENLTFCDIKIITFCDIENLTFCDNKILVFATLKTSLLATLI